MPRVIKNLNLQEVYIINCIAINIHGTNAMAYRKGELVMRTTSVVARYLAGIIFLVFGLNGFLNFIPLADLVNMAARLGLARAPKAV